MRFKHAMTATAMGLVQIRQAWRMYFRQLSEERRELARRQQRGWGG
jgi:hypothetical protein